MSALALLKRFGIDPASAGGGGGGGGGGFSTDFSEYATEAQPTGWTLQNGNAFTVEAEPSPLTDVLLRNEEDTTSRERILSVDGVSAADVEILALVRSNLSASQQNTVYARGSFDGSFEGYKLYLEGGATRRITMMRDEGSVMAGGSYRTEYEWGKNEWHWLRFRVNGTTFRAKAWGLGESEPGSWMLDTTDATHQNGGFVGVGSDIQQGVKDYAYFAIATGGASPSVPAFQGVNVALVVADDTHSATTNVKTALESWGHAVTTIDEASVDASTDWSSYDVLVLCRATPDATFAGHIRTTMDGGKPVVWDGSGAGLSAGSSKTINATHAALIGTVEIASSNTDEIVITNASHAITAAFGLGTRTILSSANFAAALDSGQSFVGTKLAEGEGALNGQTNLVAIDAGTTDLDGGTTGARSVWWGDLYAGQSAYATDGGALLDRCVRWAVGP